MDDVFYSYQIYILCRLLYIFLPANWPLTFMYFGRNSVNLRDVNPKNLHIIYHKLKLNKL